MPQPIVPGDKRALNRRIVEALAKELYYMELNGEPSLLAATLFDQPLAE